MLFVLTRFCVIEKYFVASIYIRKVYCGEYFPGFLIAKVMNNFVPTKATKFCLERKLVAVIE